MRKFFLLLLMSLFGLSVSLQAQETTNVIVGTDNTSYKKGDEKDRFEALDPVKYIRITEEDDAVTAVWGMQLYGGHVEDFETGDFTSYDWVNDGAYPWVITENAYEGSYAMTAGNAGLHSTISTIEVVYEAQFDGIMSFYHKVSSEGSFDKAYFYMDGEVKSTISGEVDWKYKEIPVAAGVHTYKWAYEKDESFSAGLDAYFVDNISFCDEVEPVPPFEGGWIYYDDGAYVTSIGLNATDPIYWGVSFPPTQDYAGYTLTKVSVFDADLYYAINSGTYTVNVYVGGNNAPGILMSSQDIELTGSASMVDIVLNTPVVVDPTQMLWITFYTDDVYFPIACSEYVENPNSDWISMNGATWGHASTDHNIVYSWMIRGYLENSKGEVATLSYGSENKAEFKGGVSTGELKVNAAAQPVVVGLPSEEADRGNGDFIGYNLYRKSAHGEAAEMLLEQTADTSYVDNAWATIPAGCYQWGVSALYEVNAASQETSILWSDAIDKDMTTTVTVSAATNSGDPVDGTVVNFVNMVEEGIDFSTTLNATGTYTWNDFRKGTYELSITKEGYTTDTEAVVVDIWNASQFNASLTEMLEAAENLYVSPTGWAIWDAVEDKEDRAFLGYNVYLDETLVAENLNVSYLEHENITDGVEYTTTVVANYTMGAAESVSYTWTKVSEESFEGVNDLTATMPTIEEVTLSWTVPASDKSALTDGSKDTEWIGYDDGTNLDDVGGPSEFEWGIMFPASALEEYIGYGLTKVSMFTTAATTGSINIYLGGNTAPSDLVHTQPYSTDATLDFVEFELTETVTVNGLNNLWITFTTAQGVTFPAAISANTGDPNGRWIAINGLWSDLFTDHGLSGTWMIRGFLDSDAGGISENMLGVMISRNGELLTTAPFPGSSYTDKNGTEGDEYCVRLVYGGEENVTYYAMSEPDCVVAEYVMDCSAPTKLHALDTFNADGTFGATLIWPYNPNPVGEWLYYDDGVHQDGIGGPAEFEWGIMLPSTTLGEYDGTYLTRVSIYAFATTSGNINIYYGGTTSPGELVHSQAYSVSATSKFEEIELTSALPVDVTQNIWVTFTTSQGTSYPAAVSANTGNPNGRWVCIDGTTWGDLYLDHGFNNTWMVRAYVTDAVKTTVSELTPITDYEPVHGEGELLNAGVADGKAIDHYNIYRSTTQGNYELIAETNTRRYFDEVETGTYYYQVTAVHVENGEECESDPATSYEDESLNYVVVDVTAIEENGVKGMMVYPNPAKDVLNIMADGMQRITITNALGQVVYDREVLTDNEVIEMSGYETGVYMVRIMTENGVAVERITVVK